jgi:PAS domain S-box-containing protein
MEGGSEGQPGGYRAGTVGAPSFRLRLIALVGLVAGGLLALAGLSVWQSYTAAQTRAVEQMLGTARALAMLVDQEFARLETLLLGLAADPRLADGNVEVFLAAVRRLEGALDRLSMAMAEESGRIIATSAASRLPEPAWMPPELAGVFASEAATISNFFENGVNGEPVVAVALPLDRREGLGTRFALSLTLHRDALAGLLARQSLPDGAVASVHDRNGIIVARTRAQDRTAGRAPPEALRSALATGESGTVERVTMLEGESGTIAFARALSSGYGVAIALPDSVLARARYGALARLAAFAVPIAGLGTLLALLLALQLRQALAGLRSGAAGPKLAEVERLRADLADADRARAEIQAALRDRTTWLEQTQLAATMGVWERDVASETLQWSAGMYRLFGMEPRPAGAIKRDTLLALVVEEDHWRLETATAEAERSGIYEAEFRVRRGDGAVRWIRAQGVLEYGPDGKPRRLLGANLDITDRRALEEAQERLLEQKDLLAAEMHHRVKNSLQLVQGLLLLQARAAAPEVAARLREAAARIVSIAAVHRRLYEGSLGPVQDAAEHLTGLAEDLRQSIASSGRQLALDVAPGARLVPEQMAALGLLVTELVTNAMKYGTGVVTLRLRLEDGPEREGAERGEAVVEVADQGAGFPDGFDPAKSGGLGMRVALAMARQLRGSLSIGPGAQVVVRFPIRSPSPSPADLAASK